ncbi:MAG: bifunctional glutamate N-acetyltransferase/amino-acid acetyltransferase ArgJ [Deltaproteobacteria bacterium]|nr:bifunctional glutamate N-acetyltransferase/amino-acid acetyltransferase ArgJ [Deltaproteobacteria bacterium]
MAGESNIRRLSVRGFRAGGIASGIKKGGRKDLALIVSDSPSSVAGVFTSNRVKAAPVLFDIKRAGKGVSRGVIINSGNANACTGEKGFRDAKAMAKAAEGALGLKDGSLLVASTGVIGVPLPIEKITSSILRLSQRLSPSGWMDAAEAIRTTDAFAKAAVKKKRIGGRDVTLLGIAKGAGMICPDMATMLAFFATDAVMDSATLKDALSNAVRLSFNRITVDNGTSTNDTVLIFANGLCGGQPIRAGGQGFAAFSELLTELSLKLSHMVVRDGEGATRFIAVEVRGAVSEGEAKAAARKIAGSLLVKTAFFGGDPNWGRIMAALGSSGIKMREGSVEIYLNRVRVVEDGMDTGMEKAAARAIKKRDVTVEVDLKLGSHIYKLWTTDLSYDYVRINSSYRS